MNINDMLPSKHLKAWDLQGREPVVTIAAVRHIPLGKSREKKWVLDFVGKTKYLILNATMLHAMAGIGGDESDRWVGVVVQLYTDTAKNVQTQQPGPVVRIKAPVARPVAVRRNA